MLSGNVFITGGAGFLARAIYRRARAEDWPCKFTAYSRGDATHAKLRELYPEVRTIRGDVADENVELLASHMQGADYVIHAAATKYVDLGELAARNTVRINVDGSQRVIDAAVRAGVPRTVAISTDKACQPVNVYGMSKAIMERLFQEAGDLYEGCGFTAVRYGNVVGSTGSVATVFERQIREAGTIRITDPRMTRFWMGVDEAINLILFALVDAEPGTVVIPRPRAADIVTVATAAWGVARLRGLVAAETPQIDTVGVRPGEKRHEALMHAEEASRAKLVAGDRYFVLAQPGKSWGDEEAQRTGAFFGGQPTGMSLLSSLPRGGWIGAGTLQDLIIDAESI